MAKGKKITEFQSVNKIIQSLNSLGMVNKSFLSLKGQENLKLWSIFFFKDS